MIELGMKNEIEGAETLKPLQLMVDSRGEMPTILSGQTILCGYDQGFGQRLFICETPEDIRTLDTAYGRGCALRMEWYAVTNDLDVVAIDGKVFLEATNAPYPASPQPWEREKLASSPEPIIPRSAAEATAPQFAMLENGSFFRSVASSLMFWKRPPKPITTYADSTPRSEGPAQPAGPDPNDIFQGGLTVSERVGFLNLWLTQNGFRESPSDTPRVADALESKGLPTAESVKSFWQPAVAKASDSAFVFFAQTPPRSLDDVSIAVFEHKFGETSESAFRRSHSPPVSLARLVRDGSFIEIQKLLGKRAIEGDKFDEALEQNHEREAARTRDTTPTNAIMAAVP